MGDVIRKKSAKQAILEAAVTLFARLGFEGASFSEITKLCGAKRSLVLFHYGSKEELWRLAVESVSRRFDEEMKARLILDDDAPDETKMRAGMVAYMDTLVAVPEFAQILLREGTTPGPRLDWIGRNFAPPITQMIRYKDKALEHKMKRTMLRDVYSATFLSIVALGPLFEISLAAALRQGAGVYPLTEAKRDEIIEMMMKLALG